MPSSLTVSSLDGPGGGPIQFSATPQFPTPSLGDADTSAATTEFVSQAISASRSQTLSEVKWRFSAAEPLPTLDIGPIWHDTYNSWMTWQSFTNNGANYTGYASVHIGSLLADTQPSPRAGFVASGSLTLSRTTYAALRAWAMHNGIYTSSGAWQAGGIQCADNADGTTFRIYDIRGEFPRFWDNGRGADSGRAFGSWQKGSIVTGEDFVPGNSVNTPEYAGNYALWGLDDPSSSWVPGLTGSATSRVEGWDVSANPNYQRHAGVTRPRNFSVFPAVKF